MNAYVSRWIPESLSFSVFAKRGTGDCIDRTACVIPMISFIDSEQCYFLPMISIRYAFVKVLTILEIIIHLKDMYRLSSTSSELIYSIDLDRMHQELIFDSRRLEFAVIWQLNYGKIFREHAYRARQPDPVAAGSTSTRRCWLDVVAPDTWRARRTATDRKKDRDENREEDVDRSISRDKDGMEKSSFHVWMKKIAWKTIQNYQIVTSITGR